MFSAQVFLLSKPSKTSTRQFRAQLLAGGKSFTDNQSSRRHYLIKTNKCKYLQTWQSQLETEVIKSCEFLWNCEFDRNDQKQRRQSATEPPVHLAELWLWHFPLTTGFVDATELKLETLLLLFICLFTHSHESAVLFLLLLCVVLVLYSYQESTLFVTALDPFNYNKTGCNQYQIWWGFFYFILFRVHRNVFQDGNKVCLCFWKRAISTVNL